MSPGQRTLGAALLAAALLWHVLSVLAPAWTLVGGKDSNGRDFASYYYAAKVASEGGNPWSKPEVLKTVRADKIRKSVHPFLYPPPFLFTMAWAPSMDLASAYRAWFWLHELCLIAAILALWMWWRPLGRAVPFLLAFSVAALTAVPNNHLMGQANFPPLLFAILGLWATDRNKPMAGGALMAVACMFKMSPALFVLWWLIRREWVAAGVSVVAALLLTLMALPLVGFDAQLDFYTRVLPGFASGAYNGLSVPIGLYGNHSIPSLLHAVAPGGSGGDAQMSVAASVLSAVCGIGLLGGLGWMFRRGGGDTFHRAAQASAVGVALLLLPVYTYEHHVVWAIPAAVIGVLAVARGRLPQSWAVPLGIAIAIWAYDMALLKAVAEGTGGIFLDIIRESKFAALLVLLVVSALAGVAPAPPLEKSDAEPDAVAA